MNQNFPSDKELKSLLKESELRDVPDGLNDRIMTRIYQTEPEAVKKFPFLSLAWILMALTAVLLPLLLNYIFAFFSHIQIDGKPIAIDTADNLGFLFMVMMAASLLLIAERLIRMSVFSACKPA